MSGRKVLVTGGSGFIGSALVKALVQAGARVRVLDDNSRGRPRWLVGVENDIEFIAGKLQAGGTPRRCPDISKLAKLGYKPRVPLDQGLRPTLDWYWRHTELAPKA